MEHATPGILLLIIVLIGPVLFYMRKARQGARYFLRPIRGIEEIEHAIGRAAEQGKSVIFSTGMTDVSPLLFAILGILRFVTEKVSQFNLRLVIPARDPESIALFDATLQAAYQKQGKIVQYDPTQVRYLSSEQLAYASGYQGLAHREQAGATFLFGSFAAESLILAESGQQVGAMQIAGTVSNEQIPFFVTSCDYTLLGEELYAASAYLTEEPTQLGSIRGQDFAKVAIVLFIATGIILETLSALDGGMGGEWLERAIALKFEDLFLWLITLITSLLYGFPVL